MATRHRDSINLIDMRDIPCPHHSVIHPSILNRKQTEHYPSIRCIARSWISPQNISADESVLAQDERPTIWLGAWDLCPFLQIFREREDARHHEEAEYISPEQTFHQKQFVKLNSSVLLLSFHIWLDSLIANSTKRLQFRRWWVQRQTHGWEEL